MCSVHAPISVHSSVQSRHGQRTNVHLKIDRISSPWPSAICTGHSLVPSCLFNRDSPIGQHDGSTVRYSRIIAKIIRAFLR
eukprot:s1594_g7.t1